MLKLFRNDQASRYASSITGPPNRFLDVVMCNQYLRNGLGKLPHLGGNGPLSGVVKTKGAAFSRALLFVIFIAVSYTHLRAHET